MEVDPQNPEVVSARNALNNAAIDLNLLLENFNAPLDPGVKVDISIEKALLAHQELGDAIKKLVSSQIGLTEQSLRHEAPYAETANALSASISKDGYCSNGESQACELFLTKLKSISSEGDMTAASIRRIAIQAGLADPSIRTIQWLINALNGLGLIELTKSRGAGSRYKLTMVFGKMEVG
jgi:hypothetical protein